MIQNTKFKITFVLALIGIISCPDLVHYSLQAQQPDSQPSQRGFGGRRDRGMFGGRGGNRGGIPGGLGSLVGREDVIKELQLTEEQVKKLQETAQTLRPSREEMEPFIRRMREAESEEERAKIREEMGSVLEKKRKEGEAVLFSHLNEKQVSRLKQIQLQENGYRQLGNEETAKSLKLTEEQMAKVKELQSKQFEALRELGRRATPEEREKLQKEYDSKIEAVLTTEQKSQWKQLQGPPLVSAQGQKQPGSTTGTDTATVAPRPRPQIPMAPKDLKPEDRRISFGKENAVAMQKSESVAGKQPEAVKKMSFNFQFAPWDDVLKLFAESAGYTLDLNDVPPGTFSYFDQGSYTPTEALDIINGYLLQKGYIIVRRNRFLVVLNIDNGIPPNLVPIVASEEIAQHGNNELMSVSFPIEGANIEDVAKEVQAILGPQGKSVALKTANTIIVTDIGSNLLRVKKLLEGAIANAGPTDLVFRSFDLKYIDAAEAEKIVRNQFGLASTTKNVSSSAMMTRYYESRSRRSSSNNTPAPAASPNKSTQVTADPRTNRLLVTASPAQIKIAEEIIKSIDVNEDGSGKLLTGGGNRPFLRVYTVTTADSKEVTKTLDAMIPGVVVNEDARNRKIHIVATPKEHETIDELIRQLDGEGGSQSVSVINLSSLDPISASTTLRSLFLRDGNEAPTIEADLLGRRLLVRGTPDQVIQIKALLAQLGEDGSPRSENVYGQGPVRTIPLGGRDSKEILQLIDKLWSASSGDINPIRIVVPSDDSLIRKKVLGEEEVPTRNRGFRNPEQNSKPPVNSPIRYQQDSGKSENRRFFFTATEQKPEEKPTQESRPSHQKPNQPQSKANTTPTAPKGPKKKPVAISTNGDNLIISSTDIEALNRLEQMIEALTQAIPPKSQWTVFYLRSADATATAKMLENLFPTSSVSEMGSDSGMLGGLSSIGGSLMDATGLTTLGMGPQTLRIIPESRSNALYVTGPADKVRSVEQMLKVLDASELPASLRDRSPGIIPVEYASASDVERIIKDLYKDYLQPPQPQNSTQKGNPLAAMMGGRNQQKASNAQPVEAKLAVSVDENANQLLVSANDSLFQEIESLVRELDYSAQMSRKSVRVVTLNDANSVLIQNALSSLLPNVSISTTGSARKRTSGQTPDSSNKSATPGNPNTGNEEIRRFFEQRMRERMGLGQPGGPSTPGSSRPSRGFQQPSSNRGGPRGGSRPGRSR